MQLEKALEEPTRRRAAADTIAHYCSTSKHDFQEHVPSLLTVSLPAHAPPFLHSTPESNLQSVECSSFAVHEVTSAQTFLLAGCHGFLSVQ